MAQVVVDVSVDSSEISEAEKQTELLKQVVDEVTKGFQVMGEAISESTKAGVEGSKQMQSGTKKSTKSVLGLGKSFGGLLKSLGLVGLALQVFEFMVNIVRENQRVMDVLNTVTTAFEIVIKKLLDSVLNLAEPMKAAFEDPIGTIKSLGEAIKDNIINRFEAIILIGDSLADVFTNLFEGDWKGATDGLKDLGTAAIQLNTGLDAEQQAAFVQGVKDFADEAVNATTNALEQADALVKLRNEVKLLEAGQQLQQLTSQKLAEDQRQIRDDDKKTIEERIAANEELGVILDEQLKKEQFIAQRRLDLARAEAAADQSNIDLKAEVLRAEGELADVFERIEGQRSEQLTNRNALEREALEIQNELRLVGKTEREKEIEEIQQQYNRLQELARIAGIEDEAIEDERLSMLMAARERFRQEDQRKEDEAAEAKIKIAEEEQKAKLIALNGYASALSSLSSTLGQETAAGKGIAVASSLINTYSAIAGQLAAFSKIPVPGYAIAQAIATGAAGFAQVRKILSVKVPNAGGGGSRPSVGGIGGGIGGGGAAPNFAGVDFGFLGEGGEARASDFESLDGQENGVRGVRAYVASDDVTRQQNLDQKVTELASLNGE
jgi:hypothetical protein